MTSDSRDLKSRLLPAVAEGFARIPEYEYEPTAAQAEGAERLGAWLAERFRAGRPAEVVVVCTGNSRRSILGATMGNVAAAWFGREVRFHSAGTAPSAFNRRSAAALAAFGLVVSPLGDEAPRGAAGEPNPRYQIQWGESADSASIEFSKALGDAALPKADFAAMMVCDEADAGCPIVRGAAVRIPLPFHDPKSFDDTPEEASRYAAARDSLAKTFHSAFAHAERLLDG